ncbi:Z1 domain-containing protein [Guptibacillus sedimenti]|uniref:Z1 domain-containing protein n=1 Tax=Guptibacillus sedimenti TaxID=3025680 RepID=UPI002360BF42|nr:Z1 domain-containing protein [Pseudalkalibacillus sedimenti]
MVDVNLPIYDHVRSAIRNLLVNSEYDWGKVYNAGDTNVPLKQNLWNLKAVGMVGENVTEYIWKEIVSNIEAEETQSKRIDKINNTSTIISIKEDNNIKVPDSPRSSWQLYKKHLESNGFKRESIRQIEGSTLSILKRLSTNTETTGPIKGLVIGHVQSGKTASMAALMAMAADYGWNAFFVLSGMIENLRKQTERRLFNDLNHPGNNNWEVLSDLSKKSPLNHQLQSLHLNEGNSNRYINICLKNKTRLENLLSWLTTDKNKLNKMKILIIDDEADQASINTKNEEERAKINELIIKLVDASKDTIRPAAMNYVSYTATPYSNFLNESSYESLYPKDFIAKLPVAPEYFGPKQIFGIEGSEENQGLDIIREVSQENFEEIKRVQEAETHDLPLSMKKSIAWFLVGTSIMRYYKYSKPISMLIHTSQMQFHHQNIANAVDTWINETEDDNLIKFCEEVFNEEINKFSLNEFRSGFKNYPIPNDKLNDYPAFINIKSFLFELIQEITHIKMDNEGDLTYHNNIHLCIDNCSFNGITEGNSHIRLAYPQKRQLEQLEKAPAFIIIGGSTLSRGLTIEGLISTYFLRASTTADTLMQMGRWFGYRKGYELLPRIWMTKDTYNKFLFLSKLEEELREELEEYMLGNKSPVDFGPRVKNSPQVSWLRITSKNKMQEAEEVDMDFTGTSIQTIHFDNDLDVLERNINITEEFLGKVPKKPERSVTRKSALVYRNVDFSLIKNEFLLKMKFNERSRTFNQIELFTDWYDKVEQEIGFKNWNVVVAGIGEVSEVNKGHEIKDSQWMLGTYSVGKVNRSAKSNQMEGVSKTANIGVLRAPSDLIADIPNAEAGEEYNKDNNIKNSQIMNLRSKYNMDSVPQLIIYRINKNSEARVDNESNSNRVDLNFEEDIIGLNINIPGSSTGKPAAKGLRVKIEPSEIEE